MPDTTFASKWLAGSVSPEPVIFRDSYSRIGRNGQPTFWCLPCSERQAFLALSDCGVVKSPGRISREALFVLSRALTWSVTVTKVVQESLTPEAVAVRVNLVGVPTGSV